MFKIENNFLDHIALYEPYKACVKEIKENNEQTKLYNLLLKIQKRKEEK